MQDEYEKYIEEAMSGSILTTDIKTCPDCKAKYQGEICPQCGLPAPAVKKIADPDDDKEIDRRERR